MNAERSTGPIIIGRWRHERRPPSLLAGRAAGTTRLLRQPLPEQRHPEGYIPHRGRGPARCGPARLHRSQRLPLPDMQSLAHRSRKGSPMKIGRTATPEEVAEIFEGHRRFVVDAVASVRDVAADDAEGFLAAAAEAGHNYGPGMLWDWWAIAHGYDVDLETLRVVLVDVWSAAEFAERSMTRADRVALFRQADYPVPSEPLTLYRGCKPGWRRGMAWTTDRERAAWSATKYRMSRPENRKLYEVTATPDVMLCDVDAACQDGGRGECEIVVDPFRLGPTKVATCPAGES